MRCDGMDVLDTHAVLAEAVRRVREDRQPLLVEAVTYRFRGHSMADPEQYRSKEEVAHWRERDPIPVFGDLLVREGVIDEEERRRIDEEAIAKVDAAVAFADASPFPALESLYDNVYVLDQEVTGWYSVETDDDRTGRAASGDGDAREAVATSAANDEIPQQLTEALAAGEDGDERPEAVS
jgi:TPP-dependent pyruvate/acetoin dehydrogenase alpha subunit